MISVAPETAEIKAIVGDIHRIIREKSGLANLGNTYKEFAEHCLIDALRKTPSVYNRIRDDVFRPEKTI